MSTPSAPKLQQQRGQQAEQAALDYLQRQGLQLVARNYRCRWGELDLIMDDGRFLAVIEVRFRRTERYGGAVASVTPQKQARIIAATEHYIMTYNIDRAIRFDVVAIAGDQSINWIQNAFQT